MTEIEKLLHIAAAQIGTAEEPKGSNRIKYNTAYYGVEVSGSAYPWCMAFVWWCFREADLSSLFYDGKKTASCTTLMKWAKAAGRFVTGDYRPGDVVLYQIDDDAYADHTGILERVEGSGRLVVIEGNTSDEVRRVTRDPSLLWGAYRPAWQEEGGSGDEEDGEGLRLPELAYGASGGSVKAMQILLLGYGYKLPQYGADGDFGSETRTALRNYQLHNGLDTDGVCGVNTWRKLLGVTA